MTDITERTPIRTNFEPDEFIQAIADARLDNDVEREGEIRETFRSLDSGRFYDFLDEAHNVLSRSDGKRTDAFGENYSDHLIRWIEAFGAVEDLSRFPRLEATEAEPPTQ